jgi:hypothetical protein
MPVGRYNPTLFVNVDQISHMKIIPDENWYKLMISLMDGIHLVERFDSQAEAAEAAIRLCNTFNQR